MLIDLLSNQTNMKLSELGCSLPSLLIAIIFIPIAQCQLVPEGGCPPVLSHIELEMAVELGHSPRDGKHLY